MDLQEGDVNVCHRIVVTLSRVTDEKFTLRIVVFQPILQGSTYEAASDNSNVDHVDKNFIFVYYYFAKDSYDSLQNINEDDSDKKKGLLSASFIGSVLILISGIIFLGIAILDEEIDVEIAFN